MTRTIDTKIHSDIIESCKNGNRVAQYTLYNLYSKAMYNLAYRITGGREDAEDVLQDSFTEAFRRLETFRYESTFGGWLKSIVINRSINLVRRRRTDLFLDEQFDQPADHEELAQEELSADIEKVFRSVEKLPQGYRIVLTLYLLEGYDHQEIAEILSISESTSKSQYLRAKKRLRELLSEENISWMN